MFVVGTAKGYGSFGKLVYVAYKEFLVRVDESSHLKRGDPRGDRGGQGFILERWGSQFSICKSGSHTQAKYSDCAHSE